MRRSIVIFILCFLPVLSVFAQEDTDVFDNCGHDSGTLQAAIAGDGWNVDDLIQVSWSPTCRYLSMRLPSSHGKPGKTIVWDAVTNIRLGFIEGFAPGGRRTAQWDERGEYLMIHVNGVGTYLWQIPTNRQMLINPFECGLTDMTWDYENQRLYATALFELGDNWCSPYINSGGLRVYDLNSGATLYELKNYGYTLDYQFSADGQRITLYSQPGPTQVFDRANGALISTEER